MQKIILVAGARPNFVKIAPLWRELSKNKNIHVLIVHTGQHYDGPMSQVFFNDLGLPSPNYNLNVGSNSHARQTAEVMMRFDEVIMTEKPDDVVVAGDVNSTLACALVAAKRGIRISHVEAGLRSFDRTMPEEINRMLTDTISDLLFVSEASGMVNLKNEGVGDEKIHFVGNVMIDSLVNAKDKIDGSNILSEIDVESGNFALVTIHRPSNVDVPERLQGILKWLGELTTAIPVVFPVHPRTRKQLTGSLEKQFGLLEKMKNFKNIPPQSYIHFQKLVKSAKFVITDSGGVQEETTVQGIPCITLRKNTERPVTVNMGTNCLVGEDLNLAGVKVDECIENKVVAGVIPDLWDGLSARRIVNIITR